jgi:hypothetical protein
MEDVSAAASGGKRRTRIIRRLHRAWIWQSPIGEAQRATGDRSKPESAADSSWSTGPSQQCHLPAVGARQVQAHVGRISRRRNTPATPCTFDALAITATPGQSPGSAPVGPGAQPDRQRRCRDTLRCPCSQFRRTPVPAQSRTRSNVLTAVARLARRQWPVEPLAEPARARSQDTR